MYPYIVAYAAEIKCLKCTARFGMARVYFKHLPFVVFVDLTIIMVCPIFGSFTTFDKDNTLYTHVLKAGVHCDNIPTICLVIS